MVLWCASLLQVGPGLQNISGILEVSCRTYIFMFLGPSRPVSAEDCRRSVQPLSLCPSRTSLTSWVLQPPEIGFHWKKNAADLPNRTTSSLCLSNPNSTLTKCSLVTGMPHAGWFGLEGGQGGGCLSAKSFGFCRIQRTSPFSFLDVFPPCASWYGLLEYAVTQRMAWHIWF